MMLDPGGDGSSSSPFPPDVLGLQYHYFPGDYTPTRRPEVAGSATFTDHPALYNGVPSRITTRNAGLVSAAGGDRTAALFTFDQLYRLTGQSMATPAGGAAPVASSGDAPWDDLALMTWQRIDAQGMDIAFDRNGNITALVRRNDQGRDIDRATYEYAASSDRLDHIRDAAGAVEPGVDLGDQRAGNYAYDAKGRLIADVAEGLRLSWNSRDQLVTAERRTGTMRYENTAHGMRSIVRDGAEGSFTVRDLLGIPLATYEVRDGRAVLTELPLYGQSRLGTWRVPAGSTGSAGGFTHERGTKAYELSEQTGDVAALVSDRRLRVDVGGAVSHQPQVLMAEDHYPFGMVKPGRSMRSEAFAYGFGYHGLERDDRIKGDGRHYHTEFRQYDPRVGRWMSVDPAAAKYPDLSPYTAFLNRPVGVTDPRGDDPPESTPVVSARSRLRGRAHVPGRRPALTTPNSDDLGQALVYESIRAVVGQEGIESVNQTTSMVGWDLNDYALLEEEDMAAADRPQTLGEAVGEVADNIEQTHEMYEALSDAIEDPDAAMASGSITILSRLVAGYVSTIENHARLSTYAGENKGFHYFLALAASRVGSGRPLLSASDLELSTGTIGWVFNGIYDENTRRGTRQGFREAHKMIAEIRREFGDEGVERFLGELRRRGHGNIQMIYDATMRMSGGGERGNEAARTLGRGDRSRPRR